MFEVEIQTIASQNARIMVNSKEAHARARLWKIWSKGRVCSDTEVEKRSLSAKRPYCRSIVNSSWLKLNIQYKNCKHKKKKQLKKHLKLLCKTDLVSVKSLCWLLQVHLVLHDCFGHLLKAGSRCVCVCPPSRVWRRRLNVLVAPPQLVFQPNPFHPLCELSYRQTDPFIPQRGTPCFVEAAWQTKAWGDARGQPVRLISDP